MFPTYHDLMFPTDVPNELMFPDVPDVQLMADVPNLSWFVNNILFKN